MKTKPVRQEKSRAQDSYGAVVLKCVLPEPATWVTRLVLLRLAYSADKKGRCLVTNAILMRDTGLGRSTLFRHLKWLESAGLIQRQRVLPGTGTLCTLMMPAIRARTKKRSGTAGREAERGEVEKILKRVRGGLPEVSNQ